MRAHPDLAWQREMFDACSRMMCKLTELPQPVVARVHGIATAAGCQLVSMCDLAVAADGARFALPGVNVGVFCTTPAVGVARNIARKRAMEMLLTGETIDAPTALRWGLVNRVVPAAELDAAVARFADGIKAKSADGGGVGQARVLSPARSRAGGRVRRRRRGDGLQPARGRRGRGDRRLRGQAAAGLGRGVRIA